MTIVRPVHLGMPMVEAALEYERNGRQPEAYFVLVLFLLVWYYRLMDSKSRTTCTSTIDSDRMSNVERGLTSSGAKVGHM
jgi:hypothetical protein